MSIFSKIAAMATGLLLFFMLASCTDPENTGDGGTEAQSTSAEVSSETEDWGLGVVMPQN